MVHPTHDDPLLRGLSDGVGGPRGDHAGPHRWWTPVRVMLAITAIVFALGMVQKAGCYSDTWSDGEQRYSQMCYSDLPYLYTGRGMVELQWPYSGETDRYQTMEYPVGISYFAWGTAWLTHWLAGSPDVGPRAEQSTDSFWGDPQVRKEIRGYVGVSAVIFGLLALLITWLLVQVNPRRPWDAAAWAASPMLLFTGLVNWDLLAVAMVAGALWAWSKDRPLLTGVLIGLGTATKLYPLFLLGAILIVCLRRREVFEFGIACGAAVVTWVLANLPAVLHGTEQWKVFWSFNSDRAADLGSVWLMLSHLFDANPSAQAINVVAWVFFCVWCLGVLVVGMSTPTTPRVAQLGFLIVAGFLLVNKVYSPQYVLWLLPLAVLARPRWRDLLIWQAGELFYFCCVWWYLGDFLSDGSGSPVYDISIAVRVACEVFLIVMVVRDMFRADRDPVPREPARFHLSSLR